MMRNIRDRVTISENIYNFQLYMMQDRESIIALDHQGKIRLLFRL